MIERNYQIIQIIESEMCKKGKFQNEVSEEDEELIPDELEQLAESYQEPNDGETKIVDVISMEELEEKLSENGENTESLEDEPVTAEHEEKDEYKVHGFDLSESPLTAERETYERLNKEQETEDEEAKTGFDDQNDDEKTSLEESVQEESEDASDSFSVEDEEEEAEDTVHELKRSVEKLQQKEEIPVKKQSHKVLHYVAPSLDFLNKGSGNSEDDIKFAEEQKQKIDQIIIEYKIKAHVERYVFGPTVIVFLVKYDSLTEDVTAIRKTEKNLQMYLANSNIRMLTPIPNMPYAGIEVPRPEGHRSMVLLGDMLRDPEFINSKKHLPVAVGKDSFGKNILFFEGEKN